MTDTIIRVAARGDGITADGRHAALAAPGDTLTASGDVIPGPHHQTPPCRHFPRCGGCQLQHLDDVSYADFITDRISGALAAHGLETEIRAPQLSPPRSRRRAALQAETKGGRVQIGFSENASHTLVDIEECHILTPALFALIAPLRPLLARFLKKNRRARLHLTEADQGIDLLVEGIEPEGLAAAEAISDFCTRYNVARFAIDSGLGAEVRWEPEPVTITLAGVPVALPTGAFLQATRDGETALIAAVREAIGGATTTADLFAGLGTFTFALPGRVYAGEAARDAIGALKSAAALARRQVFADHRDLFRRPLTTTELNRFGAIVLDPPRAGAREQALLLADSKVPAVAYVSCNPSSFARDAEVLCKGGYSLDWIQPVGQFRWSTHVELAAKFSR
ncbi:class I SAM-dependent RNA methyltransferase [Sphingomonas sp. So64.6b]|uniref:class I SAM-dependent RNA methyltransferase n=1 Tax=Sphingomonas sp. So64.6b TaxID=2997354 RepID=UPI0016018971|nr:class I SAM-dependent RNA methyltransferase [Sphingomonas sp. So64.6b]QNA83859.1 class I SAM-dependent RNA methyltransferase [Sphingomonas sp. So64.6b]